MPTIPPALAERFDGLTHLIGNTPLLVIECEFREEPVKPGQLSGDVTLRGFRTLPRSCSRCDLAGVR